jgi:hypothetical protein
LLAACSLAISLMLSAAIGSHAPKVESSMKQQVEVSSKNTILIYLRKMLENP